MARVRRILAIAVAIGLLVYAEMLGPRNLAIVAAWYMAIPLIAIWFGDPFGQSRAESLGLRFYDTLIEVLGWLLLCCTPLVLHVFKWRLELVQ